MNTKPSEEFVVGKHSIGWVDSDLLPRIGDEPFLEQPSESRFQVLSRYMSDAEIESELKPGICTAADVLAFLKNPPEGSKDGNWNLFYFPSCVVRVHWYSYDRAWRVHAWPRDVRRWRGGGRVFSPATGAKTLSTQASDTKTLGLPEKLVINGITYLRA